MIEAVRPTVLLRVSGGGGKCTFLRVPNLPNEPAE